MQNDIDKIINNSLMVDKTSLALHIKFIINEYKNALEINKKIILEANKIDKKNKNGFIIDFNIINRIFNNLMNESFIYGDVKISRRDDDLKIVYGKEIMDLGNVVVINDGNPYVLVEMIIRNIMAGNSTIFANCGFMYGTNQLLIKIISSILEKFHISKNLIQIYVSDNYDDILSNYANIDLVVCIGNRNLQNLILSKSKNKTLISGYENFDLYIENLENKAFLEKIINTGLSIQVYISKDVKIDYDNAFVVDNVDEAIVQINYNGSRYSASIFTDIAENASKFIKEVKTKLVTVNTSPTIERIIDIKQSDLYNEKTVIYPAHFNFK